MQARSGACSVRGRGPSRMVVPAYQAAVRPERYVAHQMHDDMVSFLANPVAAGPLTAQVEVPALPAADVILAEVVNQRSGRGKLQLAAGPPAAIQVDIIAGGQGVGLRGKAGKMALRRGGGMWVAASASAVLASDQVARLVAGARTDAVGAV